MRRLLVGLGLAAVFAAPVLSEPVDVCASTAPDLKDFIQEATLRINIQAVTDDAAEKLKSKPTSDGLAEGGRLDLLRRAFLGLGLGQVNEEEGQLVFNFNPLADQKTGLGLLSYRAIVHKPTIYGPLDKKLDELDAAVRAKTRDEIEKDLGELDDYEFLLRWTPSSQTPIAGLQRIASEVYDNTVTPAPATTPKRTMKAIEDAKEDLVALMHLSPDAPIVNPSLADICANPQATERLQKLSAELESAVPADGNALTQRLTATDYFRLADLIEGEPRFVLDASTRQRAGAVGPDEFKANLTFQWGWVSYTGAEHYAGKGKLDSAAIHDYLEKHKMAKDALPLFSLAAEYTAVQSFHFGIPGVAETFSQESSHKLSAKASAGTYLGKGYAHRIELSATYDDVSDDITMQNRFIAQLSWVEQLNEALAQFTGGSELVVTALYANKPEFRGDVNQELGVRAGLKWSFGKKDAEK